MGSVTRDQAINNIIDSVASEQTALSKIIEAESLKIKAATEHYVECDDLLCVNKSVESMLNTITKLEIILQSKLQMFECTYCNDNCK